MFALFPENVKIWDPREALEMEEAINTSIIMNQYRMTMSMGQRVYQNIVHRGKEPPENYEIFIGFLPRDCFADTLIPLFHSDGQLFELRLLLTFGGENRGFAFARFCTIRAVKDAIIKFDNYQIRPNWEIIVKPSLNNKRVVINNIRPNLDDDEILLVFADHLANVVRFSVKRTYNSSTLLLEYDSHKTASIGRRMLTILFCTESYFYKIYCVPDNNHRKTVDWASANISRDRQMRHFHDITISGCINFSEYLQ